MVVLVIFVYHFVVLVMNNMYLYLGTNTEKGHN